MANSPEQVPPNPGLRAPAAEVLRWFASTRLAVALIVGVAVILAAATFLESARGREYAQWYVYKSPWFMALLGMLALNIFAATIVRFPWRRGKRGFLLTHAGVLVLLAGSLLTFENGIEGQLSLVEGESGDSILMTDHSQLTTVWRRNEHHLPSAFIFQPGSVDWPDGKSLDLGELGGVQLEVLKFYRHARTEEAWVEDPSPAGGPAVQIALSGADGTPIATQWLVADPFAGEVFLGSAKLAFQRVSVASMLEDFLDPPKDGAAADGILSVHHEGRMVRIPVRENVGKKVAVGQSGIQVEIASYLPDARPDASARFTTASNQPNNPLLELKVYLPGKDKALRQIAFAKHPLLSLEGIHGGDCPVKFWYHHPAVMLEAGTQFLQMPDGKLNYRVVADGKVLARGEAKEGDQINAGEQFRLSVVKYLPHARQKITFLPIDAPGDDTEAAESAVLVKVQAGGKATEVWLKRGDPEYGFQQITTPKGELGIAFGYERRPLGFSLKLVGFQHDLNPGMMGDASFASAVRVIDKAQAVDTPADIAMNQPLVYGGFTFYQSGHDELPDGKQVSILAVAYDPGRFMKYLGSLMVCLGVFITSYGGAFSFLAAPWARLRRTTASATTSANASGPAVKTAGLALLMLLGGATAAFAAEDGAAAFDWRRWQSLPVQDGGRQKPLDTLAWETFRTIGNKSSFADPQTQQKLDSTALYLVLLFTRQGWDRPASSPHGMPGMDACTGQSGNAPKPDAWDREPLLLVDSLALRTALGLPADQKYISYLDLGRAEIQPPDGGQTMPFIAWAKKLLRAKPQELSRLEKNGIELAERYWTYQDMRRGQKLEVLPVEGSKTQQWGSAAQLLQTQWNEKNDSTGQIQKAKEAWQKAQAAYLAGNAEAFNVASANFIAALREVGPQLGDYPSAEIIDLEVAYNHWAPFRFAWVCTLLALLAALLGWESRRRPFYRASLGFYATGVLAMLVGFGMRTAISARAPVTNMYESVVFVGLGAAALGLVFEIIYGKRYMLTAAAAVSTLALILADTCPAILDPSIRPLTPVLRSNFWLVIHVMTIMLSYAAFALALLTGNIALGFYLRRSANRAAIAALSKLTYQLLQAGVLLLIIGTFLGASWADYAWGRFWGWDPKEVWALITLLGYLALLHARHVGWVHDFGMAAFSVLCFTLILMAWYGVNFVLGTGLHSYGFGGGGQSYVLSAIALQFLYVGAAGAMRSNHSSETGNRS